MSVEDEIIELEKQIFGGGTPKVPLKIPSKVENGAKYYNLIIKDTIVRSPRVLV